MEDNAAEQNKKQKTEGQVRNYDWLKGYQFVKGKSGNPKGRPKGAKSLKTFVREYLESLPNDEKIVFLQSLHPMDVWRMAEGNPANNADLTSKGQRIVFMPQELLSKYNLEQNATDPDDSDTSSIDDSSGQA